MKLCILTVDELGIIRIELSNMLGNLNLETMNAKDEIEAENLLRANKSRINIIVWVFNTIRDSDYEAIKRIKAKGAYKHIPIVIISRYTDKKYIIRAIQAGATEYIAKPFDESTVLQKFSRLLGMPLDKSADKRIDDDVVTFNFPEMLNREIKAASRGVYPLTIMLVTSCHKTNGEGQPGTASKEVTEILYKVFKTKLRDTDTIFMYGVDNIVLLLPFTEKEGAAAVENKLGKIYSTHTLIKNAASNYHLVTASVSFPEDGRIKQKLMETLEKTLNEAIKRQTCFSRTSSAFHIQKN